jgi:hypothetical protein
LAGPSEAAMDAGFLRVTVVGEGVQGGTAKCSFYFPTDPVRAAPRSGLVYYQVV